MFKELKNVKTLAALGVFIAIEIMSSQVLSLKFADKKFSFTFLITATMCAVFGVKLSVIAAIVIDLLGNTLFPPIGGFFPGFTLTAIVTNIIYAYFLHKEDINLRDIIIATTLVSLIPNMFMNTLWISIMYKNPFMVKFIQRIPNFLINYVLKIILMPIIVPRLVKISRKELGKMGALKGLNPS